MNRRQARIWVVQALCHDDAHGGGAWEALKDLTSDAEGDKSTTAFAEEVCRGFITDREKIDAVISASLEKWSLGRVEPLGRGVLRAATAELATCDTPPKVVLNEAIEIARDFATDDLAKFINGVLDSVLRKLTEEAT